MNEHRSFLEQLELPPTTSDARSVFAFSLHKSGSTLLFNMLSELAAYTEQPYFSMQDQFFINGIPINEKIEGVERLFKEKGYIYGGFRFFPTNYILPNMSIHKNILLVRNPLDALVSMYFSQKSSHKIPNKGLLRKIWQKKREDAVSLTIDEFVQKNYKAHLERIMGYSDLLNSGNCRVYRYEDIIYEKFSFLKEISSFYEWDVGDATIRNISDKYDVIPEAENELQHIRQVHPNNYKKHLSIESQIFLKEKFDRVLSAFGYYVNPNDAKIILEKI